MTRNKLDRYIIFVKTRWMIAIFFLLIYFFRIITVGGFYVVSYIMGLFIMQITVQFLLPLGIPDIEEENDDNKYYPEFPNTLQLIFIFFFYLTIFKRC